MFSNQYNLRNKPGVWKPIISCGSLSIFTVSGKSIKKYVFYAVCFSEAGY